MTSTTRRSFPCRAGDHSGNHAWPSATLTLAASLLITGSAEGQVQGTVNYTQTDLSPTTVAFASTPLGVRVGPCNMAVVRIRNSGAPVTTSFDVRLDTMNDPEAGGGASQTRRISGIGAGEEIAVTFQGVSAWPGFTAMAGIADAKNEVREANERNNNKSGSAAPSASCYSLAVGDTTTTEGSNAIFIVKRGGSTLGTVTVRYATKDGSARGGSGCTRGASDFQQVSGTLSFAPRQTSKQVSVPVCSDRARDLRETFTLELSSPSFGAGLTKKSGTATISR